MMGCIRVIGKKPRKTCSLPCCNVFTLMLHKRYSVLEANVNEVNVVFNSSECYQKKGSTSVVWCFSFDFSSGFLVRPMMLTVRSRIYDMNKNDSINENLNQKEVYKGLKRNNGYKMLYVRGLKFIFFFSVW